MKLAVIGGGSTYTPELIDGVIKRHARLPITHIHLVDIEPTKLEIIAAFAKRMIAAAQLELDNDCEDLTEFIIKELMKANPLPVGADVQGS